jgi:2-polyprenyl-3-methyl-5-hydroxy-6-metoxy-1,4-benzoquinol methylase
MVISDFMIGYNEKLAREYAKEQEIYFKKHKDMSRELLYKELSSLKGKIVLDAGCGFGFDLQILENKGAKVYGIDASKTMIKLQKKETQK